jgi:rhamnosyltransferase
MPDSKNTYHGMSLASVIVTFNPDVAQFDRVLHAALSQNHMVIVVDNGSAKMFTDLLNAQAMRTDTLHILPLHSNRGIASALNQGIMKAKDLGAEYVLLLDHDSIPSDGLLNRLALAAQSKLQSGEKVAAFGARILDPRSQQELGFYRMRYGLWHKVRCSAQIEGLIACDYLNSSGSFIPMTAFTTIGLFNEQFFIDHVDTEWFMRARSFGYTCYGYCGGALEHYMGDAVIRYWLFGWRHMPCRSPLRHYYIVRNSLWLYRYAYVPLAWKLNNALKLIFTLFYFSIFDKQRSAQFTQILRGVFDGIKGER